jgi:hypothetical protein
MKSHVSQATPSLPGCILHGQDCVPPSCGQDVTLATRNARAAAGGRHASGGANTICYPTPSLEEINSCIPRVSWGCLGGLLGFPGVSWGSSRVSWGSPGGSPGDSRGVCYSDSPSVNVKKFGLGFLGFYIILFALTRRQRLVHVFWGLYSLGFALAKCQNVSFTFVCFFGSLGGRDPT